MNNITTMTPENAVADYLSSMALPLVLFRQGEYSSGDEMIPLGTRYVAKWREHMIGWQLWLDKKPVDSRMGFLHDGFSIPDRNTLGLLDESEWEKDQNGNPRDPWQRSEKIPFIDAAGEEHLFVTGSWGGHCALVKLQKACRLGADGRDPLIELATENHKNSFGGINPRPVFRVIGWVGKALTALPKTASQIVNDQIPDFDAPMPF
jgi:hypothetical protein